MARTTRTLGPAFALLMATGGVLLATTGVAVADGPTTFSNTAAIAIPATGSPNQIGPANPYPSPVTVSGMSGLISTMTVTFNNLTHSTVNDIDALLVGPTGANLIVLSDIGDATSTLAFANNATLTFADAAASNVPTGNILSGTYKPTNNGAGDPFAAPAPTASTQTTLAGAFAGSNPNGAWKLYVVDDATGDVGQMAGGWSLSITTSVSAVATTTAVASSVNPSATGSPVTFTASVNAGGSPVTSGSVQFADGATNLGSPVALTGAGQATLTTSALAEGTHQIKATYSGATGFLTSNGTVSQQVDNGTVVTGNTFCNTGALTVPSVGPATPYASHIKVTGLTGVTTKVTATLKNMSHAVPLDLDIALTSPTTASLVMQSDVGGQNPVSGLNVTYDDSAAGSVPTPLTSGTFKPTDNDADGGTDTFPAPAPVMSPATTLATFSGADPNGTWSLWVNDDASGDSGSLAGGWCLTFTTSTSAVPTTTAVASSVNPSATGSPVTFTASVNAGGSPVTSGSVQFADGATNLGSPVALNGAGQATLTTSSLAEGTHQIKATYSGATGFLTSNGTVSQQVVNPTVIADAGGPYVVAEGGSLTLDAKGSTAGASYAWDLDGDGDYADAAGSRPTLGWATLAAQGISDGPSAHPVALRVTMGGGSAVAFAALTVTNTPPTLRVTGDGTVTVGKKLTLRLRAADLAMPDLSLFTYSVKWGRSDPVLVRGDADVKVKHKFTKLGTVTIKVFVTDKDGGASSVQKIKVKVTKPAP